jgi:hypothetical protein
MQHAAALPLVERRVTPTSALRRAAAPTGCPARYTSRVPCSGLQLIPVWYKGFAITVRTFQIRGSGRWTLDLLIGRPTGMRAFSGPRTYPTEEAAITGCCEFARCIIDGRVRNCSVDDLS